MTVLTAVDVGFDSVKARATNGRNTMFPSVIGTPIMESGFSMARKARMTIEMGNECYPVGTTALNQSQYTTGRRDPGWVTSKAWHILFCAALSELHKSTVATSVVSGLPLEDWATWSDQLCKRILGEHTFRRNGGNWQTVTIKDAVCITQPYGSLLDQAMSDTGAILHNDFATGVVAVADIGGLTLNLLTTDALEEVGRWTVGDGLGLLKALDAIARDIRADCPNFAPKAHEVAEWLATGHFDYNSEQHDIGAYADNHLAPLVDMVLNRFSEAWPEPGRFNAVLLTGGGSLALGPSLKARMDGTYPNVTIARDAQKSNSKGYLKLARDLWG